MSDLQKLHRRIRELLDYDPTTGIFRWRLNLSNVKAGSIAGSRTKKGYLLIRADKKAHLAHRLAWFWMTGNWPTKQIDHRNLKKHDNRWCNLREATNAENHLNRPRNKNNTSGYKGVSFDKKTGRYAAFLNAGGRRYFLGYHDKADEAHAAYATAVASVSPEYGRA